MVFRLDKALKCALECTRAWSSKTNIPKFSHTQVGEEVVDCTTCPHTSKTVATSLHIVAKESISDWHCFEVVRHYRHVGILIALCFVLSLHCWSYSWRLVYFSLIYIIQISLLFWINQIKTTRAIWSPSLVLNMISFSLWCCDFVK